MNQAYRISDTELLDFLNSLPKKGGTQVRVLNCFANYGIAKLDELLALADYELLRLPNFGWKALREVDAELARRDLHLSEYIHLRRMQHKRCPTCGHIVPDDFSP